MDITKLSIEELWKLAFEQQQVITNNLIQIRQAEANIQSIQAEIAKRTDPQPES